MSRSITGRLGMASLIACVPVWVGRSYGRDGRQLRLSAALGVLFMPASRVSVVAGCSTRSCPSSHGFICRRSYRRAQAAFHHEGK